MLSITLPSRPDLRPVLEWYSPQAGLYCISATMLDCVYLRESDDWSVEDERDYQQLRSLNGAFRDFLAGTPQARAALEAEHPTQAWIDTWKRFDDLRFCRLCLYLRAKQPEAVIGHSIFVFRLTDDELAIALRQPFSALTTAVEELEMKRGDD